MDQPPLQPKTHLADYTDYQIVGSQLNYVNPRLEAIVFLIKLVTFPINFVIFSLTTYLISPGISSLIISLMALKMFALILSAKWSIDASSNSSHFVFFRDISKVCRTTSVKQWIPNFKRKLLKKPLQVEI